MTPSVDRPLILRSAEANAFLWVNSSFGTRTGLSATELAERPLLDWIEPTDRSLVEDLLSSGEPGLVRARHATRDGDFLSLELSVEASPEGLSVMGRSVSDDDVLDAYPEDYDEGTVAGTLETIARIVEDQNPGYRCSILLVDEDKLVRGAGPSLPDEYNAVVHGEAIGPAVGSCGTAIHWNVPVIVEDIQADPLWTRFAESARQAGLAACWSHPFTSSSGRVLGALALYAPEPGGPTEEQFDLLRTTARMTGLAVERGRAEEALREQREREAELERQLRHAAKMEALGVLAGGVAHDFNNLLATISGNAELALMELSPGDSTREMLDRIVVTSQRAGEFCSQMLAYAGRGTMKTDRIELSPLLTELRDLAHAALSKKATLEYSLHPAPIYLDADENQILQVILNLVTNAAEAVGDSEGHIRLSTTVAPCDEARLNSLSPDHVLPPGNYLRLIVADTGVGMDAETRDRIFDPFFSTKFTGRGLGLAVVAGIVRRHGGAISVESEPGIGTTFEILLPTIAEPPRDELTSLDEPAVEAQGTRVLVIDDEDEPRRVFRLMLERSGFSVVEAADGEQALERFGQDPEGIDGVLLDLSMPKMGGHEVFQEMRRIREDVPVVLISGYSEQEVLDRLEGAPIAGSLQKPVKAAALVEIMRKVTCV